MAIALRNVCLCLQSELDLNPTCRELASCLEMSKDRGNYKRKRAPHTKRWFQYFVQKIRILGGQNAI